MSALALLARCNGRSEGVRFLQCPAWRERGTRTFRQKARQEPAGEPVVKEPPKGPGVQVEQEAGAVGWAVLLRPAVFTVAFSGASLGACAVWQYERMRGEALRSRVWWQGGRKAGEWREGVRSWWAAAGEGERLFWPLAGLNLLVWAGWRVPALQATMMRWFTSSPAGRATCLPLLLSTFSHHSLLHLGCNMVVLHSFLPPAVHLMGREQFLGVYLSAGVISSFASLVHKVHSSPPPPPPPAPGR